MSHFDECPEGPGDGDATPEMAQNFLCSHIASTILDLMDSEKFSELDGMDKVRSVVVGALMGGMYVIWTHSSAARNDPNVLATLFHGCIDSAASRTAAFGPRAEMGASRH